MQESNTHTHTHTYTYIHHNGTNKCTHVDLYQNQFIHTTESHIFQPTIPDDGHIVG